MTAENRAYEFHDASERIEVTSYDVSDFSIDNDLGRDHTVTLLIKWTNQRYHDENLRAMFTEEWDAVTGISKVNVGRHRNQYYAGKIATASLASEFIDALEAETIRDVVQPTGVDMHSNGMAAFACGNVITLHPPQSADEASPSVLTREDFARLHSVAFNKDGDRLLTASSSLDLLYEVDLMGVPTWTMDMWDTPFNQNILGQRFYRDAGRLTVKHVTNPSIDELRNNPDYMHGAFVIDDPSSYQYLGLTTNLTPVFPNGAAYGEDGDVLITTFHSGEGWQIDRATNKVRVAKKDMKNPHGFQLGGPLDGYMVTDTGHETVSFLSPDLKREQVFDFSSLPGKKPGLDKVRWLQHTSHLTGDLYGAIQSPRQALVLFDPVQRTRRDIAFDPDWGVQQIALAR